MDFEDSGTKKFVIRVTGSVQGVGFRYRVKNIADSMGVNGMVRNENDGSVTIHLVADPPTRDNFIARLKSVQSAWTQIRTLNWFENPNLDDYHSFSIAYF
jgi:acylphosphatase